MGSVAEFERVSEIADKSHDCLMCKAAHDVLGKHEPFWFGPSQVKQCPISRWKHADSMTLPVQNPL